MSTVNNKTYKEFSTITFFNEKLGINQSFHFKEKDMTGILQGATFLRLQVSSDARFINSDGHFFDLQTGKYHNFSKGISFMNEDWSKIYYLYHPTQKKFFGLLDVANFKIIEVEVSRFIPLI